MNAMNAATPNSVETQATVPLTVVDVQRTADTIALITLRTQDGQALPGYEPGCHIDAHLTTEAGEPITRQYSLFTMSPTGDEQGLYGVEVTREHFAHGGAAAMYRLEPGDTLRISALRNNFPLAQGATRSILVGAGVGIAPIFSLARGLALADATFRVIYFASSAEKAVLSHLIEEYCADRTRNVFASGAREQQADIVRDAIREHGGDPETTHLYVCGPQGFMDGVIEVAGEALPARNIHWEAFRPTEVALAGNQSADGAFEIEFRGMSMEVPEGKSVLDVLEEEDLPIMSQCAEGTCGTCVMRVVEGTPDHRDSVFTEEQHEQGAFATCVSRSLSPTLVLERWRNALA